MKTLRTRRWAVTAGVGTGAIAAVSIVTLGTSAAPSAAAASPIVATASKTKIDHVVVILKENRSFDSYFGKMSGVNGATVAKRLNGSTYKLQPEPLSLPNDIGHSNKDFKIAYNGGKMNGFENEAGAHGGGSGKILTLTQFSQGDIPNYWKYASTYGVADQAFASWKGSSFGNNLYEIAGQSGKYDTGTSCIPNKAVPGSQACHTGGKVVEGLPRPKGEPAHNLGYWGCDDPAHSQVKMFKSATNEALTYMYPCFRFKSLPDTLASRGLSWGFYQDDASRHHDSLDAIDSIRNNPSQWKNVHPAGDFLNAVNKGTLPAVSWYLGFQTEHPPKSACAGENETVKAVNAVMNSKYWASTAIIVVWDEWGGFYDHVKPPQRDAVSYGFRVPFLVISPWTKAGNVDGGTGYVSHEFVSHVSMLKFIESNWGLPKLGGDDTRPSTGGNLMDFFNFSHSPKPKKILTTRSCGKLTAAQQQMISTEDPD